MTEDVGRPPWFHAIKIYLVWEKKPIEWDLTFNDYISFMWNLKTKAFVTLWTTTINKMHILKIDVEMSPHVAMAINDFVHSQKEKAFDRWMRWEDLYSQRCDSLPIQWECNKEVSSLKSKNNEWC